MLFNETRDMLKVCKELAEFFAHESCGKCYPCQLGTERQYQILSKMDDTSVLENAKNDLSDIGWTMTEASLCGLGQTAANFIISAMDKWPEIFETT